MKLQHLALGTLAVPSVLAALCATALAQEKHKLEIDGTFGTRIGGALDVELEQSSGEPLNGRVSADSSPAYGGILGFRVQSNGFVFLSYSRQDTTIRFRPAQVDLESTETNGSIEYFQFGGNLEATRGRLTPYMGFSVGAGRLSSHEGGGDSWRFTGVLDGGVKLRLLPMLHLRFVARLPITITDGELYCYTGYGCVAVSNATPFVQGDLHAGLGLAF